MDDPKIVSLYEDGRHFANISVWAVALQVKRLETNKPELEDFDFQPVVDFHFLVTGLARLQEIAETLKAIDDMRPAMEKAIEAFKTEVPGLRYMRNVLEHMGEYARGDGKNKAVQYREIFTIGLDPDCIQWLGHELRPRAALAASDALFRVIKENPPAAYIKTVNSTVNSRESKDR